MRLLPCLLVILMLLAQPAAASQFGAILSGPVGGWLLFVCVLAGLLVFGAACRQFSIYLGEQTHASRVARLMDVLANQADGIAELLLAHPPAPGTTLLAVRQAAIAQAVAYAKINLPGTIALIGATDAVMAARVDNYVSGKVGDAAAVTTATAADTDVAPEAAAQPAALPSA